MERIFSVFLLLFSLCGYCSAQSENIIEPELQQLLNRRSVGLISINIVFDSKIDNDELKAIVASEVDKDRKRELFVKTLKEFSENSQKEVLAYLENEERNGRVANIKSHWITNLISCEVTGDVVYELSAMPGISIIGHNAELQIVQTDDITSAVSEYSYSSSSATPHVIQINADDVWNLGYTGKGVVVAVLDSGTNLYHYDLKDHLWCGYADTDGDGEEDDIINGWNFIADNENIVDDYGHGTHCAGIVCGDGTIGNIVGVAPDATLMTVKIVNRAGGGSPAQMISGVEFAIANGADILSLSLGFKTSSVGVSAKKSLRDTFVTALEAGVVVCAAAGNDGGNYVALENVDIPAACPPPYLHPDQAVNAGGLSSVVCVGAVDEYNNYASFSSRGPVTWQDVVEYNDYLYDDTTIGLIRPDICAPGNLIYSLKHDEIDKYKFMTGTSQATPCVAGVMALMLEKNSNLTPADLCRIIENTAMKLSETKNNYTGSGVIDALAAINSFDAANEKPFININVLSSSLVSGVNETLNIDFRNLGWAETSNSATIILSTEEQYVTILNPIATLGTLGVGETKNMTFDIAVSTDVPNGYTIPITVTVKDSYYTWRNEFLLKVNSAARIVYSSNTPMVIDAGEEVELTVNMINSGNIATVNDTKVTLKTNSPYVTMLEEEVLLGVMDVNEEQSACFKVKIDSSIPDNSNVSFDLYAVPNNYTDIKNMLYNFEIEQDEYGYLKDGFNGWTTFDASNDGVNHPWWHSSENVSHAVNTAGLAHSGIGLLMSETYCQGIMTEYTMPIDNYLVSPKVRVTENTKFSFWARAHQTQYYKEHFGVAVSESGNYSASFFTTIEEWDITESATATEWVEYTIDLSAYSGKDIYVAIRHFFTQEMWNNIDKGFDAYILQIDDVVFTDIIDVSNDFIFNNYSYFSVNVNSTPLPAPSNLVASAESEQTITLSWDAVEHAMSYNIYRNGEYLANTSNVSYTDTGLNSDTEYSYCVAAVYNGRVYEQSEAAAATTGKSDYSLKIKTVAPTAFSVGENTLSLTIVNNGKYEQQSRSKVILSCDNPYVTINTNNIGLNALYVNEEKTISFTITIDELVQNNAVLNFNANITQVYEPYSTWNLPFTVIAYNDNYIDISEHKANAVALVDGWGGVGYPVAEAIESYLAAVDAATTTEDIANAQAALYAAEIQMPVDGKAYTIKCVQKNGTEQYFQHTSAALALSASAADATPYICRVLSNEKVVFVNNEGKYLVWRGGDGNFDGADTNHRGYVDEYSSEWCDLQITAFESNQWVVEDLTALVGYVNIKGKRAEGTTGCYIVRAPTETDAAAFDTSSSPYYNASYSSAIVFTEVDYPNTISLNSISGSTLIGGFEKDGLATFSAPFATVLPDGVKAYYATSKGNNDGSVSLIEYVDDAIPANEGFIMSGEARETYVMTPAAGESVADLEGENIFGNSAGGNVVLSAGQCYLLGSGSQGAGFYACSAGTLKMNKAYLNMSPGASRSIAIRFPSATSIDGIEINENGCDLIYDFSGRRLNEINNPGFYIVNGKKVLVR